MSWFVRVPAVPAADFAAAADAALARSNVGGQDAGGKAQAEYAVRLVKQIVSDGVLTFGDRWIGAAMGGHHTTDGLETLSVNVHGEVPPPQDRVAPQPPRG